MICPKIFLDAVLKRFTTHTLFLPSYPYFKNPHIKKLQDHVKKTHIHTPAPSHICTTPSVSPIPLTATHIYITLSPMQLYPDHNRQRGSKETLKKSTQHLHLIFHWFEIFNSPAKLSPHVKIFETRK